MKVTTEIKKLRQKGKTKEERTAPVQSVQPNGGRLNVGGNHGNVYGGGMKATAIRKACAEGMHKAIPVIVAIANGENEKATISDTVSAWDKLGKYGVGEARTVVPEEIINALAEVLAEDARVPGEAIGDITARLAEKLKDE